jgi:hypothetical protein
MRAREEEETMAEMKEDQADSNSMVDTEVTPFNVHPSLVLDSLEETSFPILRDLGEDKDSLTIRGRLLWTRNWSVW